MKKKQNNPWDVLGIQPDSDIKEVKQAYKNLSMLHHPDKGGKVRDWLAIADAYETIKTNKYVPILPSTSTQLLNLTLSLKQQILGLDDIVAIDDGNEEIYMQVKIRPGAVSGDKIQVVKDKKKYIINIKDKAHSVFTRQGSSLIMYKKLSVIDALKRTPILIEGPTEEFIEVDLPEEIQTGTILTLPKHGLYDKNKRQRGNLKIHLNVELPILTDENINDFITRLKDD
jgi:DnaJ-class molecular chaperone